MSRVHFVTSVCPPGLTVPLVVTKSGEKLGKSAGNAVWLGGGVEAKDKLSRYLQELTDLELEDLSGKLMVALATDDRHVSESVSLLATISWEGIEWSPNHCSQAE